jgi:hypothetical protein
MGAAKPVLALGLILDIYSHESSFVRVSHGLLEPWIGLPTSGKTLAPSTTSAAYCCTYCGSDVAMMVEAGGDPIYTCQTPVCKWACSNACPEALTRRSAFKYETLFCFFQKFRTKADDWVTRHDKESQFRYAQRTSFHRLYASRTWIK